MHWENIKGGNSASCAKKQRKDSRPIFISLSAEISLFAWKKEQLTCLHGMPPRHHRDVFHFFSVDNSAGKLFVLAERQGLQWCSPAVISRRTCNTSGQHRGGKKLRRKQLVVSYAHDKVESKSPPHWLLNLLMQHTKHRGKRISCQTGYSKRNQNEKSKMVGLEKCERFSELSSKSLMKKVNSLCSICRCWLTARVGQINWKLGFNGSCFIEKQFFTVIGGKEGENNVFSIWDLWIVCVQSLVIPSQIVMKWIKLLRQFDAKLYRVVNVSYCRERIAVRIAMCIGTTLFI